MSRPLVLLHGFTGTPEVWTDVVGDRPSLRPQLHGHGRPAVAGGRTFDEEIDRLASLVIETGATGAHLVGYSLGGRLALGLLARHEALFARATIIGAHPGLASQQERAERIASDERWASMLEMQGPDAFARAWTDQPLFASQTALPGDVRAREDERRRSHTPAGLASSLRAHGLGRMPDWSPHLERLRLPVTLVAGAQDGKFTRLAQQMGERIPTARVRLVDGAGHNVVLERPSALSALLFSEET